MKFNFAKALRNYQDSSARFGIFISSSLESFTYRYTPYLGNAITRIVSDFTYNPIIDFGSLVAGVSRELRRIKQDAEEGKSDNPLADVKGVCSSNLLLIAVATLLTPKDLSPGR